MQKKVIKKKNGKKIYVFSVEAKKRIKKRERQARLRWVKKNSGNLLIMGCVITLAVFMSIRTAQTKARNREIETEIAMLQEEIINEEKRSEEIQEKAKYITECDDKYVEEVAREKLGLVYPNEIVFVEE